MDNVSSGSLSALSPLTMIIIKQIAACHSSSKVQSASQRRHDQLRVSGVGKLEIEMNEYGISNEIYS